MHRRRKWQPTPVLLPGESQGRGSLVGCRLWGRTESDIVVGARQRRGNTADHQYLIVDTDRSDLVLIAPQLSRRFPMIVELILQQSEDRPVLDRCIGPDDRGHYE